MLGIYVMIIWNQRKKIIKKGKYYLQQDCGWNSFDIYFVCWCCLLSINYIGSISIDSDAGSLYKVLINVLYYIKYICKYLIYTECQEGRLHIPVFINRASYDYASILITSQDCYGQLPMWKHTANTVLN